VKGVSGKCLYFASLGGYGFNVFNSLALSFRFVTARMVIVPGRMR
jgi:hypothetical protein